MLTIGAHMSIAKGLARTAENVVAMEANTMQIFSRNPRGSKAKVVDPADLKKLRQLLEEEEDARQKDSQILERMDRIGAGIRELSDELGRKVTLEEIAGYLDMPQEEVKDLLKLTGETFEDGQEQDRGQGGQEDGALTFGVEDFQIF